MNYKLLFALSVAAGLALLSSCVKETVLTIDQKSLSFTSAGGTQTVSLTANKAWTASVDQNWCKVSPAAGSDAAGSQISISCDMNSSYDERSCTVIFTSAEMTVTVGITQDGGKSPVLGPTSYELTKSAQQLEIQVQVDGELSVEVAASCKDWIKYNTTRALTASTVVLDIAENNTYDTREGQVTIKQVGGIFSSTITIKQTQQDGLFITTPEYYLSNESHTLTVEVSTNVEFEVTPDADWVKHVRTKGLSTKQIILTVDANEAYDAREAQVEVKQKNGGQSGVITIRQEEQYGLMVSKSAFDLTAQAQTIDVDVNYNVDFDVVVPDACKEWIKLVSTKGLSQKTYTFSVEENETFEAREGSVTFKQNNGPLSGTVTVRQEQNNGLFIDQSVYEVSGDGGTVTLSISANVDYVVEPQVDWIQVVRTKGLQTDQIVLAVSANDGREPRKGTVAILQESGNLKETVVIEQGKSIILQERDALIAFYNLMNGPNWSRSDNWCTDKPLDQWYGIHSSSEWSGYPGDGHVREVFLAGVGVSGDLTKAVDILMDLPYLEEIGLQGNPLRQPIPASIQQLKTLRKISMWECQLTGTIPPELGNLEKLEYLEICENPELTGPIPASLGNLSEAKWINVSDCDLTGNIPVEITKLNKLEFPFDCWGNHRMSGVVPAEFTQWKYWNDWWGHIVEDTNLSLEKATPHIPDFSVTLIDGSTVTSDVVKGQKLTILFQWATWCGFSAQFLPLMRSAYKQFAKDGLYVLSWADPDEPAEKVLKHMSENGIIWPTFLADAKTNKIKGDLFPKSDRNAHYPYSSFPGINAFDSNGKLVYTNANSNQMETFVPFMQEWFGSDWTGDDETVYESTDYSQDGRVTTVQKATEGKGIDIIITGDAFSDRLIADGTFMAEVNRTVEAFFSTEPYRSMRQYFNVYAVNAVSKTEVVTDETAFHTYWSGGNPNILGGDNGRVLEYARKAVDDLRMDDAVIIVLMNLDLNGGTCYLFDCPGGDYGRGVTVSYIPTYSQDRRFKEITVHEAGGHGFAKLADEYTKSRGAIPADVIESYRSAFDSGWWKNIDFTDDPAAVKWASFIDDSRYASEGIGVYQGGMLYDWGVYRPTLESVMRGGGSFNAPSRQAIWYRINKLAQGGQWTGTYEDFVAFDFAHPSPAAAPRQNYVEKQDETLPLPVVHNGSWREFVKQDTDR